MTMGFRTNRILNLSAYIDSIKAPHLASMEHIVSRLMVNEEWAVEDAISLTQCWPIQMCFQVVFRPILSIWHSLESSCYKPGYTIDNIFLNVYRPQQILVKGRGKIAHTGLWAHAHKKRVCTRLQAAPALRHCQEMARRSIINLSMQWLLFMKIEQIGK